MYFLKLKFYVYGIKIILLKNLNYSHSMNGVLILMKVYILFYICFLKI